MTPFWLSHHAPSDYARCVRFGRWHICARCLGTYSTLACALVWQFVSHCSLEYAFDVAAVLALTLPATLDWAYGVRYPHRFSNGWRIATGVGLGLALGRTLFIHFQRPFPPVLVAQAVLVATVALPVILVAYRKRRW
jgi:uncharacterized membrane protein